MLVGRTRSFNVAGLYHEDTFLVSKHFMGPRVTVLVLLVLTDEKIRIVMTSLYCKYVGIYPTAICNGGKFPT